MYRLVFALLLIAACGHHSRPALTSEISSAASTSTVSASSQTPQHNIKFNWPDRRPMGMIMLASFDGKFRKENQMNYVFDVKNFEPSLLRFADTCIKNMKKMNAQGMITWDIEGQQYAHPASYIGDPTFLPAQMKLSAAKYFKKFRDAGFRVGVCIRPDSIAYNKDKTWIHHYSVTDQYKNLEKKIQFAIDNWGCSIFYIDSNIWPGKAKMDVSAGGDGMTWWTFKLLHDKFPDVLLVPEWKEWNYFRCTAPFYTTAQSTILLSDEHKKLMRFASAK